MSQTSASSLSTTAVGKSQVYALMVDSSGNPLLDVDGNEQIVDLQVVGGRLKVDSSITGSLAKSATVIIAGIDIPPTIGIRVNVDTDANVLFVNDTIAVDIKLLAGADYAYSIKKVNTGVGIVGLY